MATIRQNLLSVARVVSNNREIHFNAGQFAREHLLRSWWLTAWLIVLAYITFSYTLNELVDDPVLTGILLAIWVISLLWTAFNDVTRQHVPPTKWLKNNLYSSLSNSLLTLLLTLLLVDIVRGFINWAFLSASFSTDADVAKATLSQYEDPGAVWGAVINNIRNLMVFRYPRAETWRIWAILGMVAALAIPSFIVYRRPEYRKSILRRILTLLWFLSPILTFLMLRGVGGAESPIPYLNPNNYWGGLLLTMVISIFAIVASFPLGLLLALGRRSTIPGVPAWLTALLAAAITLWGLLTSTLDELGTAQSLTGQLIALWPLLIPVFAYLFQRYFNGNVVALFSTLYIEMVRGVPLITVLFASIILFPILLPTGMEILGTWRVMVAFALFAAAYLAENVRGGLQSIPKGQYEAADALGLRTYKKYRLIILPQALRAVIPAIVGQFIGLFKDTTLVAIVGLIDLLGAASLISAQPDWLGVRRTPYVFVAIIYFIGSSIMASYSRRLERQLGVGER